MLFFQNIPFWIRFVCCCDCALLPSEARGKPLGFHPFLTTSELARLPRPPSPPLMVAALKSLLLPCPSLLPARGVQPRLLLSAALTRGWWGAETRRSHGDHYSPGFRVYLSCSVQQRERNLRNYPGRGRRWRFSAFDLQPP